MGMQSPRRFCRVDDPPETGRVAPIVRIADQTPVTFCIVADKWEGYFSHWYSDKSYRCAKPEKCLGCDELKAPRRWTGFLDVCNADGRGTAFIQLSKDARDSLLLVKDLRETCRGMLVQVRRLRKTIKSPLVFQYIGEYSGVLPLRSAASAVPTIARLWKEFERAGRGKGSRVG